MTKEHSSAFSVVGIGAAACVACCAGPILAFLGGLSLAGLASTAFIGAGGLAIAAGAITAFVLVRRSNTTSATPTQPILVDAPTRRPPSSQEEARR
jgi:hypothetical protein